MVRGMAAAPLPGPEAGGVAVAETGAGADGGGGTSGAGGTAVGVSVTSAGGKATTGGGASEAEGGTSIVGALPMGPDAAGGAFEGVFEVGCAIAREDQPSRQGQPPSSHTNPRM
jgi:hypothetical protein